jgi:hypothetical protein
VPGTTDGEPIAIAADHVNMVKFASREDLGYGKVSGHLQVMAKSAPGVISARWEEQDKIENGMLLGLVSYLALMVSSCSDY